MFWLPFTKTYLSNLPGPWPQKLLQAIFDWYSMRLNFLWLYFDSPTTEEFERRVVREASLRNVRREAALVQYVSLIETKATSLLQHISIMIALTVFFLATIESSIFLQTVLVFEIFGYLWAALACLRCLLQISSTEWMRSDDLVNNFDNAYLIEGIKREVIYRHSVQVVVLLTIILATTILLHSVSLTFLGMR